MYPPILLYLVSVWVMIFFFCEYSFGKPVEINAAIEIIKKKEKTITSISWVCKTNKYNSNKAGDLTPVNTPPLPCNARVFIDSQGCYRVQVTTSLPNLDNVTQREYEQLSTFDGKTFRVTKAFFSPKTAPRIEGYIYHRDMMYLGGINWNLYPEGIGYVFPYCAWSVGALHGKTKKLSEYLEYILSLKRHITVDENDEGVWTISVPDYIDIQNNITVYVQIEYDPSKGKSGAVLSARRCDSRVLDNKALGEKVSYLLQKAGEFYVPQMVKQEHLMGHNIPSQFTVLEYGDIKINIPLSDDDFVIAWKNGTEITDYVTKKNYLVSGIPEDESEAVRRFMLREEIIKPDVIQNKPVLYFRIVLIVLGLSLIAYGLYSHYKKKKNVS